MVKRLRRKGDVSSAPPPKAAASRSTNPDKFKKKGVKTDPEKLKAACTESANIAEASASAQTPTPKPVKTSPAAAAAAEIADDRVAQSKTEDGKFSRKETMKGREEQKGEGASDGVTQTKTEDMNVTRKGDTLHKDNEKRTIKTRNQTNNHRLRSSSTYLKPELELHLSPPRLPHPYPHDALQRS